MDAATDLLVGEVCEEAFLEIRIARLRAGRWVEYVGDLTATFARSGGDLVAKIGLWGYRRVSAAPQSRRPRSAG